ncbi:MAG: YaiI/YqxD family protein [Clostridia bacterium]|nr:YaiI/YqxD family protein [Clostridia bacterium]
MKIFIDADACPVTDIAIKIAKEYNLECTVICDTSHIISREDVKKIIVSKGNDSADFALVNMISKGDIAITQDYGLACMCLGKRALVINQNGLEYTNDNIMYLMETRHAAKKLRMSGKHLKGPKPRSKEQDIMFEANFRKLIERCIEV